MVMNADDSPTDPPPQPRDSRLEAFLRRAVGVLAEQRQWSAQTQVKLKSLAKELKLPPELFQMALQQLADTGRASPPTRYEQAYGEYLKTQFAALPGEILSRVQERKAFAYGQQKFQLAPDVCERCIARVADELNIARISDEQALAYARGEITRLVGRKDLAPEMLQDHVRQLTQRWGLEPLQAERLLTSEMGRRRVKQQRAFLYRWGLGIGVVLLSVVLIASIVWLGRMINQVSEVVLTPVEEPRTKSGTSAETSNPAGQNFTVPDWWSENQRMLLERMIEEGSNPDLLVDMTNPDARRRSDAYHRLWQQWATWDRLLLEQASQRNRWLRQAVVQDAMLDIFWLDPQAEALQGWLTGLEQTRSVDRPSPGLEERNARPAVVAIEEIPRDFLMATAAEQILLRVYQRGLLDAEGNRPAPPESRSRFELLTRLLPGLTVPGALGVNEDRINAWRQRGLAEATERMYYRLQEYWLPGKEVANPQEAPRAFSEGWPRSCTLVAESLRMITDEPLRARLLLMFWSSIAGIAPDLAEAHWPEIAAAMEIAPPADWGPLLESWTVQPADSAWSNRLTPIWQANAQSKQKTLAGRPGQDAILLQKLFSIDVIPSPFQTRLRSQWVWESINEFDAPAEATHDTMANWEKLSRSVTLAYYLAREPDWRAFDQIALNNASLFDSAMANTSQFIIPPVEFDQAWNRLLSARDLDSYQQSLQGISGWWQRDVVLTIPQAQRLCEYLRLLVKPEEQTCWLIAFHVSGQSPTPPTDQTSGSWIGQPLEGTLAGQLVAQPCVAIALADHFESDRRESSDGLRWLLRADASPDSLTVPTELKLDSSQVESLVRWLRETAASQLQSRDSLQRNSRSQRLASHYQFVLDRHRTLPGVDALQTSPGSLSSRSPLDPLLEVLLAHDRWSESLAALVLEQPDAWMAEYRRQVDRETHLERALWVAELQVLKLLKESWNKESR